jgi:hypothetical protein
LIFQDVFEEYRQYGQYIEYLGIETNRDDSSSCDEIAPKWEKMNEFNELIQKYFNISESEIYMHFESYYNG